MPSPNELLKKLGLSDAESRIYLTLLSNGALSAREIGRVTKGKRPTVYYAIRELTKRGLVTQVATYGVKRFQAQTPEHLMTMLELREQELRELADETRNLIPYFDTKKGSSEGLPRVTFYEGEEAMKQIVMETLYCKSKHIDSIAPSDNFFWQIGQAFSQSYINDRVRRKITTRNLWEQALKPEIMTRSYKNVSQVRILPSQMHHAFRSTIFLYDDKVMYISSLKNGYVLLVQSAEHYELMLAMYNGLWAVSKQAE